MQELKFARQKLAYCYFSGAATLFSPELSDARISWAKGGVLTTVVDDFFDVGGSKEEMENLIDLVEKYNDLALYFFVSPPSKRKHYTFFLAYKLQVGFELCS